MQHSKRNSALGQKCLSFLSGELLIKTSQRKFSSQNTPLHNFLTTQPIPTNRTRLMQPDKQNMNTKLKNVEISM
jgi:SET domain-containing protein